MATSYVSARCPVCKSEHQYAEGFQEGVQLVYCPECSLRIRIQKHEVEGAIAYEVGKYTPPVVHYDASDE